MATKAQSARVRGMGETTRLLEASGGDDPQPTEALLARVYQQLRTLAGGNR